MQLKGLVQGIAGKGVLLLKRVFQGGLTPQKLAQTLCLGTATGIMPLLWGTTILSALFAALFKLNQAAMQALNYLCYPLQLALFIPFCQLGGYIFPWGPAVSVDVLSSALHGHLGAALSLVGWATVKALGAWLLTAAPLALIAYPLVKVALKRRGEPCGSPGDSSNPAA